MASNVDLFFRPQLVERRQRLRSVARRPGGDGELERLLAEVDAALARLDDGTFGLCEVCHDAVEADRLIADPLLRFCLDHLSEAEQRALEQDLQAAARIQRGLLPPAEVAVDGWMVRHHWEPAGLVSGDYCDVLTEGDGRGGLLFICGDVAGKGVAAAMLMSHLHASFRSLLAVSGGVAELVERANRVFRESAASSHYATLVCGRALPDGELELCNAGHPAPRVIGESGVRAIDATSLPVGTFYSARFSSVRLRLQPGETLLLFTDGLTEARDAAGREFGDVRLEAMLARLCVACGDDPLALCRADLAAHLAGGKPTDDLTLMAVSRKG